MAERRPLAKSIFVAGGLLVWAAHFMAIYIFTAVACAWRFADTEVLDLAVVPLTIMAATIVAGLAVIWVVLEALYWRGPFVGESRDDPTTRFLRFTAISLALPSLIAIIWEALPALIVPPCA